jgi:hypothetical protein
MIGGGDVGHCGRHSGVDRNANKASDGPGPFRPDPAKPPSANGALMVDLTNTY